MRFQIQMNEGFRVEHFARTDVLIIVAIEKISIYPGAKSVIEPIYLPICEIVFNIVI